MISLTHTPIGDVEFCKVFNLSRCAYNRFIEEGIISLNYSDYLDPAGRARNHNAWDLIMFSFILALGWPIRPKSVVMDEAEEIYDALIIEIDEYTPLFRTSMDGIVEMSLVISSINIFSNGNRRSEIDISSKRLKHIRAYLFKIANLIYEIERDCNIDKFTQSTTCLHSGRTSLSGGLALFSDQLDFPGDAFNGYAVLSRRSNELRLGHERSAHACAPRYQDRR